MRMHLQSAGLVLLSATSLVKGLRSRLCLREYRALRSACHCLAHSAGLGSKAGIVLLHFNGWRTHGTFGVTSDLWVSKRTMIEELLGRVTINGYVRGRTSLRRKLNAGLIRHADEQV